MLKKVTLGDLSICTGLDSGKSTSTCDLFQLLNLLWTEWFSARRIQLYIRYGSYAQDSSFSSYRYVLMYL
ncbi:hypothetical protein P3S68_021450 [Capsicum galapagoense]